MNTANIRRQLHEYVDEAKADTQQDWWDDVSDKAKASIERGLKDVRAGRVVSHKSALKKYNKCCRD